MNKHEKLNDYYKNLSLEEAQELARRAIYEAALIFERFEDAGLIYGNGHHAAQHLAEAAEQIVVARWVEKHG